MVAAYLHVSGDPKDPNYRRCQEIDLFQAIDRLGVHAVMGRPVLYAKEMRRLALAENIQVAYQMRKNSEDWAKWMEQNPEKADLLNRAEKLVFEDE